VSIWHSTPEEITTAVGDLENRFPGRFLLGLGTSHGPIVENYTRPYSHMVAYLDSLDELEGLDALDKPGGTDGRKEPASKGRRILAALRPRMLELARERAIGAHPYFVPAEHTQRARALLGPNSILAPEVTVVLEADPQKARELARTFTAGYLGLPNYVENLRTLGFSDHDVVPPGSDRLVDAIVCWGDLDAVVSKVQSHFDAGADHVCIQVIASGESFPMLEYRELAPALTELG
jgi:probable F420-dependent oxidoreductase